MNEYRITYDTTEGNGQLTIIERSEATARRAFKTNHKGAEISDIELIDSDVSATKDQERETLEKIKAMVAELGPQSYLATAFEGCFEDAETNIENDFAFSMKSRVETAEEKARELGSQYIAAKTDATHLKAQLDDTLAQLAAAQEQIAALKLQQLPEQLRRDLWVMVTDEAEASRARMAEAADKMAIGADNPGGVLFKDSVARYRAEKARAEAMEQRAAELDALESKSE